MITSADTGVDILGTLTLHSSLTVWMGNKNISYWVSYSYRIDKKPSTFCTPQEKVSELTATDAESLQVAEFSQIEVKMSSFDVCEWISYLRKIRPHRMIQIKGEHVTLIK